MSLTSKAQAYDVLVQTMTDSSGNVVKERVVDPKNN